MRRSVFRADFWDDVEEAIPWGDLDLEYDCKGKVGLADLFASNSLCDSGDQPQAQPASESNAGANSDNMSALWFFLSRIWQYYPARCPLFCFNRLNDNSVIKRVNFKFFCSHFSLQSSYPPK